MPVTVINDARSQALDGVTRVARVISTQGTRATVLFLDSGMAGDVDITLVRVKKDSHVEIFADQAIGRITKKEAEFKRDLRLQMDQAMGIRP